MLKATVNDEDLKKGFEALSRELPSETADILDHVKRKFLKRWRQQRLQGPPGVKARPGGIFPRFQTRKIRAGSGDHRLTGIAIGTDSKVAILQEEGGTVTAPGGDSLAVPLFARTKIFRAPVTGALRKRYKDIPSLRNVVPIKFKNKIFLSRVKKRDRSFVEPLFVLKKSIQIKPKLGFVGTFKKMEKVLYDIIARRLPKSMAKAWSP